MKTSSSIAFRMLLAGKTLSEIGMYLDMVVFGVYIFALSKNAAVVSLFMCTRLIGTFIGSMMAGAWADRYDRKKLMWMADLVRTGALMALILTPSTFHLNLGFPVIFIIGFCTGVFNVALMSAAPSFISFERRHTVNAALSGTSGLAVVVGCFLAAFLPSLISIRAIFVFDAATYLLSAAVLFTSPLPTREARGPADVPVRWAENFRTAFSYLHAFPVLFWMVLIRFMDAFGSASHNIGLPILSAAMDPQAVSRAAGLAWGSWGLGKWIASHRTGQFLSTLSQPSKISLETVYALATACMSVFFIAIFGASSLYWIVPLAFLAGAGDGASEVCLYSSLQKAPDHMRGRLFGVGSMLDRLGLGLGMLTGAAAFSHLPLFAGVALFHGIPLLFVGIFLVVIKTCLRSKVPS